MLHAKSADFRLWATHCVASLWGYHQGCGALAWKAGITVLYRVGIVRSFSPGQALRIDPSHDITAMSCYELEGDGVEST